MYSIRWCYALGKKSYALSLVVHAGEELLEFLSFALVNTTAM